MSYPIDPNIIQQRRQRAGDFFSAKGLTPAEVARLAELSNANMLYNYLNGRSNNLSFTTIERIERAIPGFSKALIGPQDGRINGKANEQPEAMTGGKPHRPSQKSDPSLSGTNLSGSLMATITTAKSSGAMVDWALNSAAPDVPEPVMSALMAANTLSKNAIIAIEAAAAALLANLPSGWNTRIGVP